MENLDELTKKLDKFQNERKRQERNKSRLLSNIVKLDADDEQYDTMYADLQNVLHQINEAISVLDEQIAEVSIQIYNAKNDSLSQERMLRIVNERVKHIDSWSAKEQREVMHELLESVELLLEPTPSGGYVKRVRFKFPVSIDGGSIYGLCVNLKYDDDGDDSTPDDDPPTGRGKPQPNDFPSGEGALQSEDTSSGGGVSLADNFTPNTNSVMMLLGRNRNSSTDSLHALALLSPSLEPKSSKGHRLQIFPSWDIKLSRLMQTGGVPSTGSGVSQ